MIFEKTVHGTVFFCWKVNLYNPGVKCYNKGYYGEVYKAT